MSRENRSGSGLDEESVVTRHLSYNLLTPRIRRDLKGRIVPHVASAVKLNLRDVFRLLKNYVSHRFMEPFKIVLPVTLVLSVFQWNFLKDPLWLIVGMISGSFLVVIGLMMLVEGLRLGIFPLGELLGNALPRKLPMPAMLSILFILGVGSTCCDATWGWMERVGDAVDRGTIPDVQLLLLGRMGWVLLASGMAVGLALVLATLRFFHGWRFKIMILAVSLLPLGLTVMAWMDPWGKDVVGLAWDCGAVVLGPVTVAMFLGLGRGVATALSRGNETAWGLGMIAVAFFLVVAATLVLGTLLAATVSPEVVGPRLPILAEGTTVAADPSSGWMFVYRSAALSAVVAVLPMAGLMFFLLVLVLGERVQGVGLLLHGVVLSTLGLALFNTGMGLGLADAGGRLGQFFASALARNGMIDLWFDSGFMFGMVLFLVGTVAIGATLAEPGLTVFTANIESLSHGVARKRKLTRSMAFGAGIGGLVGVAGILANGIHLWMLAPLGLVILFAIFGFPEDWGTISWDGGMVISGPLLVGLIHPLGIGLGGRSHGSGLLFFLTAGAIVATLFTGRLQHGASSGSGIS
ncbi:MAG: DUF1538 family protein [Magnetococcales bacterium]|nr:DUF1538 family protein [Magnetococcales bacterium]